MTETQRRTCEAFARLTALTMENTRLLMALQQQVEELRRSQQLIIASDEHLRREIAELLHGRVQTRLLMAWHRIGQCEALWTADPHQARALLAQARDEIDQVREHEVRWVSHLLHPAIIRVGLLPALRSLASSFQEHFSAAIEVDPSVAQLDYPAENRLPEPLRLLAYRVVEEALNNVYRHAGASRVEINVGAAAGPCLQIVVRDDGRGFEPAAVKPGLSLTNIAARVAQAGGSWHLASAIGAGTTLTAVFPFDVRSPDERPAVKAGPPRLKRAEALLTLPKPSRRSRP